jgi:Family of unknown function (DUF6491)
MTAATTGKLPVFFAMAVLAACASQEDAADEPSTQDVTQAVRDYVSVRELTELRNMDSSTSGDNWEALSDWFLIYEGRNDSYLVEFGRRCYDLEDNTRIIPDERRSANTISSRFDTIRGCRIHRIYELTEADLAELENLGAAPGSHN